MKKSDVGNGRRRGTLGTPFLGLVGALGAVGCGNGPGVALEESYHLTIVHLDPHGQPSITNERVITASEQRAMNEGRAARRSSPNDGVGVSRAAISTDATCASADLWLYDGYDGTGNMICLAGEGTIWLQNLLSSCGSGGGTCSWFMRIRSYWPGVDNGWIGYNVTTWAYDPCVTYFPAWGPRTNADACVQRSDQLGTNSL